MKTPIEYLDYIDCSNLSNVQVVESCIQIKLEPIAYLDGRNPRLPRKSSKNYNLNADVKFVFYKVFQQLDRTPDINRYQIEILVNSGRDRLGNADLDNYSKAILDGITHSNKVWIDDKQVDELVVKRKRTTDKTSNILVNIKILEN